MADLNALYNPVMAPAPLGEAATQEAMLKTQPFTGTQQAMAQGLTGSNKTAPVPTLPVGSGNTMYPTSGPVFAQEDIANVGGVTSMAPTEDTSVVIPMIDPLMEQENEFMDAYKQGYTVEEEGDLWSGGWSNKAGVQKSAGTKKAAKAAKRDDRYQDRMSRQKTRKEDQERMEKEFYDKFKAEGESISSATGKARRHARRESRRIKRDTRRAQNDNRKEAWKNFEGSLELESEQKTYNTGQI